MRAPALLAIDPAAGHVACGAFAAGATGRLVLQHLALETNLADAAHEGRWVAEVAQSLAAIAARRKLGRRAELVVPAHLALTKFIKTPALPAAKRAPVIAFEAAENIPYPLEEVVWDCAVLADDGLDLDLMLAAAKREVIHALFGAAESAGFRVARATPATLALYHCFRYNYPQEDRSALVVSIGPRATQLLFVEGARFYARTMALAGDAVTQALAAELEIELLAAEALKRQVFAGDPAVPADSAARRAVDRATAAFAQKLKIEITRSTVNHRRQTGAAEPAIIFLTGAGSQLAGLEGALHDSLQVRVEMLDPLRCVDVSADARAAGAESAAPLLSELVGVAARLLLPHAHDANLLPPATAEALAFRRRQPRLLAAAALGVAALLPPLGYFYTRAEAQLAEVRRLDNALMPLRAVDYRNAGNAARLEAARTRLAALDPVLAARDTWAALLADLQSRVATVEDVWLERVQVVRAADADPSANAADAEPAPEAPAETPPSADPADPAAVAAAPTPTSRVYVSGRLVDVANPQAKASPDSVARVKQLLGQLRESPFVADVQDEAYDTSQNGILRFDCTLVVRRGF